MSVIIENLVKHFGNTEDSPAVDGVSFEAPEGKITSLLGPSGSGKTTILRSIAGLEVPDGGRILIRGQDITQVPVRHRNVGFVFQGYSLFVHLSVAENIAFGLRVRGAPHVRVSQRVQELLSLVQLEGYEKRLPHQLSGGQRQRVALARALATEPSVLLLDEPFGALDTRLRIELRRWLRDLHEATQVTTLLVTHDQEEALELSDHLVILDRGQVAQSGSPPELYDAPNSAVVASFLGGASVLHGKALDGQIVVGSIRVAAPDWASGTPVRVFVRPESVALSPDTQASTRITRMVRVGPQVKLELEIAPDQRLAALLPWAESAPWTVGMPVAVQVSNARVFAT